ncbi:MAG: 3-deoxy-D-manno-octulosonic acid transferase [Rhodobacteraceae bacterium PARR1]|nr:MAG: 3-deoxy-D-manno-octulosonic acid transferase [Rhodobacteraceae bacterium PARR1]
MPNPSSPLLSAYLALGTVLQPLAPWLLKRRLALGKEDPARWREKLGHPTLPRPHGPLIWLHAVSVGEGLSVLPLLTRLVASGATVLVTSTTVTSARLLADRLPKGCLHQFLPSDLPGPVTRFLDHWRPDLAVFVESEFWPRLLRDSKARHIPMVLVNARISDTSARNWRRVPGLARAILSGFTALTAPEPRVAALLAELGADPARIRTTGSLKRGTGRLPVDAVALADLRDAIGNRKTWLAASTHPGEEEVILDAQHALSDRLLIVAPRHPQRGDAVRDLITARGLTVAQRSRQEPIAADTQVYLADSLGEMGLWFDLCPVAFIGGSLVPVGGHNAYEAVAHGSAVVTGPQVSNFAALYDSLLGAKGAVMVRGAPSLAGAIRAFDDPAIRTAQTTAATTVISAESDATAETAALILSLLPR